MKNNIIDFILELAFCFGAGTMISYSGILSGMNSFQIICLVGGCFFLNYYLNKNQER